MTSTGTLTLGMITVDTHDANTLADWWAAQMGAEVLERNDGWYVVLAGGTLPDPVVLPEGRGPDARARTASTST